ncbi:MAG: hypothetical protein GC201_00950 [Alphaproteobacteria bacterium]|nr:hypothetical protein [Alphaproteobacteria bacterium]
MPADELRTTLHHQSERLARFEERLDAQTRKVDEAIFRFDAHAVQNVQDHREVRQTMDGLRERIDVAEANRAAADDKLHIRISSVKTMVLLGAISAMGTALVVLATIIGTLFWNGAPFVRKAPPPTNIIQSTAP